MKRQKQKQKQRTNCEERRDMRTLFIIPLVLMCLVSFASWAMELQCASSTYMDCGGGNCRALNSKVNLTVDLGEKMVMRERKRIVETLCQ